MRHAKYVLALSILFGGFTVACADPIEERSIN